MIHIIRGRLSLIILVSLFTILTIGLLAFRSNMETIRNTNEQAMDQMLDTKRTALDKYLESVEASAMNVAYNKAVQDLLKMAGDDRRLTSDLHDIAVSAMMNAAASRKSVLNMLLFDRNHQPTAEAGSSSSRPIRFAQFPYREAAYFSGVSQGTLFQEQIPVYYYYLPVYSSSPPNFGTRIGTLLVILNTFELRELLAVQDNSDTQFVVIDAEDRVISSTVGTRDTEGTLSAGFIPGTAADPESMPVKSMVKTVELKKSDWRIYAVSSGIQIRDDVRSMLFLDLTLFFLCLLVLMFIYITFTNSLRRHVKMLTGKLQAAPEGKGQLPDGRMSLREFRDIEDTANDMLKKISALEQEKEQQIKDAYALKLAASSWEIHAIRRQLQPHFIYNTLDHLRGMAMYHGDDELSDQILKLATILRYDMQGGMYAVVADEIEMLSNYRDIVQGRAGKRFRIDIDCDAALMKARIPRMMLQPLVENSVQHGLRDVLSGGQVDVLLRRTPEQRMSIQVRDNGAGMTGERVEELEKAIRNADDSTALAGVGLISTLRRIQLMYREQASFELTSAPGEGTVVRIVIPFEEAANHAGSDR